MNFSRAFLVNLIMDRLLVTELIQNDFNEDLLKVELGKLLEDDQYRGQMIASFEELIEKLGGGGASSKAAEIIYSELHE